MEKLKAHHLTESLHKDAAIIFGRFNPPHFGHKAAWEIAAKHDIWYVGTNQGTQGPKDPLPFDIKVEAMKTFMPELEGHLVAEQSWFTLASMVYKKYGSVTLHIVTDSVDVNTYLPMLQGQNGKEGPHGFYHFKAILWAEAKRQSEASLVRKAIKENNPQDFAKYSGVPADTIIAKHPYFQLVRHYMMPYMEAEIAKEKQKAEKEQQRAEKEKQKAEKLAMKQTKIKGPAQELAESNLRELSTDKLAQYKKTAYADAKKADAEGDYARGDKRFKGINKATNKQFANDLKKHGQQGVAEAEGDATGVPHVTKELLQHIVKQVGAEGAHAIVKSLEWGDGAAKELLHLIVRDLEKDINMSEVWSQKYKSSINCSHPKGFSQKAHCAGKKKHTESMMTMEMTCPDCGMCQTHGSLNEIAKGAKDSNGFSKCWPGHHAAGTKKGKNGGQVRNCVPNEGRVRLGQVLEETWQQRFNK